MHKLWHGDLRRSRRRFCVRELSCRLNRFSHGPHSLYKLLGWHHRGCRRRFCVHLMFCGPICHSSWIICVHELRFRKVFDNFSGLCFHRLFELRRRHDHGLNRSLKLHKLCHRDLRSRCRRFCVRELSRWHNRFYHRPHCLYKLLGWHLRIHCRLFGMHELSRGHHSSGSCSHDMCIMRRWNDRCLHWPFRL